MHIFLALGTNLGDKDQNLIIAKDLLMKNNVLVMGQSAVRQTKALEGMDHPDYLNQVIECQTELSPDELLNTCKMIEIQMGRKTQMPQIGNINFGTKNINTENAESVKNSDTQNISAQKKWESRIIDIDILFYGDSIVKKNYLQIPHAESAKRDFILQAMCDLSPSFTHPELKKSMQELLNELTKNI